MLEMHQQPEDDFILGPPPTVIATMTDALYSATPFTFLHLYPTNDIGGDNMDYDGKYHTHAELFGSARSGLGSTTSSTMNSTTGLSPNLYGPRLPMPWLAWGQQDAPPDAYHRQHHQQHRHADLVFNLAHPPPLPPSLPR